MSQSSNSGSNYGGRVPNSSATVKTFNVGESTALWKKESVGTNTLTQVVTTTSPADVLIKGDLTVTGTIINPSDKILKKNIQDVNEEQTNKLLNLEVKSFTYKNDVLNKQHYGFIAQDFENEYSELVSKMIDKQYGNVKGINYLELVPLLVSKMQMMQKEIDELKSIVKCDKKEEDK